MSHFIPQGGNHVRIMSTVDRRLPRRGDDVVDAEEREVVEVVVEEEGEQHGHVEAEVVLAASGRPATRR